MRFKPSHGSIWQRDDGGGLCKCVALHADYSKLDVTSKLRMQIELVAAVQEVCEGGGLARLDVSRRIFQFGKSQLIKMALKRK